MRVSRTCVAEGGKSIVLMQSGGNQSRPSGRWSQPITPHLADAHDRGVDVVRSAAVGRSPGVQLDGAAFHHA
jgi:hypothetical protein